MQQFDDTPFRYRAAMRAGEPVKALRAGLDSPTAQINPMGRQIINLQSEVRDLRKAS
jgi:hypothetical protein